MAQFRKDTHQYLNDGRTIFEVVMLSDQYGNLVGPANPSGVAVDAFGRGRTSQPLTLFDSSFRYRDNGLWSTSNTAGTTVAFNANNGLMDLTLPVTDQAEIVRETEKVFAYQPGKSLLALNTFVMNQPKTNLRQRVGYFGAQNGIFLELEGSTVYFVKRSFVNGSVVDTKVAQSGWSIDKLDGAGPSLLTLDITKAQIFWTDIEWLGVGTVRCGFAINGQFIHCHSFHHSNLIASTYMTTASLPLRYEIKNTGTTASASTLKQICSTVISEGGYEMRGTQQAIGTVITAPYTLATAGTYYPVVSIRLKSTALDAIAVLTAASVLGKGNNFDFNWQIRQNADVTSVSWTEASPNSSVEYSLIGTAVTGGRILASGFINSSNQGSPVVNLLKEALFRFQLERNGLTSTPYALTLAITCRTNTAEVFGALDWEEISR
jgi:hypothetical protein